MGYVPMLSYALLTLGTGILAYSLYPTSRVVPEIPPGPVNLHGKDQHGFILLFLAGYLACLLLLAPDHGASRLLVPPIFLSGACFVLLVPTLAHRTIPPMPPAASLHCPVGTGTATKTTPA